MPELPEVETIVRDMRKQGLVGRLIREAEVHWPRTIATPDLKSFLKKLRGKQILSIGRRAKFIVITLTDNWTLLIHLRMSGRIHIAPTETLRDKHEHVLLHLDDDKDLRFRDSRKFGRWYLLKNPEEKLGALGPEPLETSFKLDLFQKNISKKKRQLKPLLLDQSFVAGLGNIYVDEALWRSKLHPTRLANSLSSTESKKLHEAIVKVLNIAVDNMGTSLGQTDFNYYSVGGRRGRNQDALQVFRKTKEPCPRCKTPIQRIVVAQRSTHICSSCQKEKK